MRKGGEYKETMLCDSIIKMEQLLSDYKKRKRKQSESSEISHEIPIFASDYRERREKSTESIEDIAIKVKYHVKRLRLSRKKLLETAK